jgi:hypothetical protein
VLIEHLYDVYKGDGPALETVAPQAQKAAPSAFLDAIKTDTPSLTQTGTEIEAFFSGTYPCSDGDALKWWKVCV